MNIDHGEFATKTLAKARAAKDRGDERRHVTLLGRSIGHALAFSLRKASSAEEGLAAMASCGAERVLDLLQGAELTELEGIQLFDCGEAAILLGRNEWGREAFALAAKRLQKNPWGILANRLWSLLAGGPTMTKTHEVVDTAVRLPKYVEPYWGILTSESEAELAAAKEVAAVLFLAKQNDPRWCDTHLLDGDRDDPVNWDLHAEVTSSVVHARLTEERGTPGTDRG